ncbi:MAG: prephenate dehydrogenase/arogenate dehydrogenase family protein [Candidatus Altiarchaeota archaeon]
MAFRVALIGGEGSMGRLFARLFKDEGYAVTISGPDERRGRRVARELKVRYAKDNVAAVKDADVVVITVPIAVTAEVIREIAPHVKAGALLMDLTSVKELPCELMAKHARAGVEVLGTHPVFSPRVGSISGQTIVLTPVRKGKWSGRLKAMFRRNGVSVVESTPKEHDEVMAVVQGMTHLAYISVGKTIKDLNFDVEKSRKFSSPIYQLMLDMVGRIIGQDPELYAGIQLHNRSVTKVHKAYGNAVRKLSDAIEEGRGSDFVSMMSEAAIHFGDIKGAMERSDKAIGRMRK